MQQSEPKGASCSSTFGNLILSNCFSSPTIASGTSGRILEKTSVLTNLHQCQIGETLELEFLHSSKSLNLLLSG